MSLPYPRTEDELRAITGRKVVPDRPKGPPPAACRHGHSEHGFRLKRRPYPRRPVWVCRQCNSDGVKRRWANDPTVAERHKVQNREWRRRNREKARAHGVVEHAISMGRLVRPAACQHCHRGGVVQASHDDYTRPLDVEWLCPMCHAAKDTALREAKRS